LLEALAERAIAQPEENWLVVLTTDHGGTPGGSHGLLSRREVRVPFIVWGAHTQPGPLEGDIGIVDVAPTVFAHLGIHMPAAWALDGAPRGLPAETATTTK